jgi:hypothetical protein
MHENPAVAPPPPLAKTELKAGPKPVNHRARVAKDHPSHSAPPHDRNYHQSDVPILQRPLG